MPNPPKPAELKRRLGNPGKRALPAPSKVLALPMAAGVPEPPEELNLDGRRLWARVWQEALTWVSPHSDMETVEQACRLVDDLATARDRYRATREPADGRMVATFAEQLRGFLSDLGFNPTSRTRLGVAEVKVVSKLEQLRRKADA